MFEEDQETATIAAIKRVENNDDRANYCDVTTWIRKELREQHCRKRKSHAQCSENSGCDDASLRPDDIVFSKTP